MIKELTIRHNHLLDSHEKGQGRRVEGIGISAERRAPRPLRTTGNYNFFLRAVEKGRWDNSGTISCF